jgi:hypothetical protein
MPGERKERWPYLRAALSSTIYCAANMQYNMLVWSIIGDNLILTNTKKIGLLV